MSVYNEQGVIEDKIKSVFDTTYPLDKISFYIESTTIHSDGTNLTIQSYCEKFPQICFYPYTERSGKSGVLNKLFDQI
jgi:hypothetical protein